MAESADTITAPEVHPLTGSSPPSGQAPAFEPIASSPSEPDATADTAPESLSALIALHEPALAASTEANRLRAELRGVYFATRPARPAKLYYRFDDPGGYPARGREKTANGFRLFHNTDDIEHLRQAEEPCAYMSMGGGFEWVPDQRRIARREEIITTFEEWSARCYAVADEIGLHVAVEAGNAAAAKLKEIAEAILEYPTKSWADIVTKASWIETQPNWSELAEFVVFDVLNLGMSAAKQERPDRRAVAAYREWLDIEGRLLGLEMYPQGGDDAHRLIPANTAANHYHFPVNLNWRDMPQPSTRAEYMLTALGIDWTADKERDERFFPTVTDNVARVA